MAQRDLETIWIYTEARWGVDQAEAYIAKLDKAMQRLCDGKLHGVAVPDVDHRLRKVRAEYHRIYFRLREEEVEVAHILHERQDELAHIG